MNIKLTSFHSFVILFIKIKPILLYTTVLRINIEVDWTHTS